MISALFMLSVAILFFVSSGEAQCPHWPPNENMCWIVGALIFILEKEFVPVRE